VNRLSLGQWRAENHVRGPLCTAGNEHDSRTVLHCVVDIHELLHDVTERVSGSASVRNVYGDPVVVGDRTVIPAARVRYAFGGGGGRGKTDGEPGGGGGGRAAARPCGALEITRAGTRFINFIEPRRMGAALALGFVLGAAVMALARPRTIELAKR
jgi:uncharacterized spore protein YtfJ